MTSAAVVATPRKHLIPARQAPGMGAEPPPQRVEGDARRRECPGTVVSRVAPEARAVRREKAAGFGKPEHVGRDQGEVGPIGGRPGERHVLGTREPIAPKIRHLRKADVAHLLAQDGAARAHDAAEENGVGPVGPDLREQRLEVEREGHQVLVAHDRAAGRRKGAGKDVGQPLAVRLVVVDDEGPPRPEPARETRGGDPLPVVGGADAEERTARCLRASRQFDRRRSERDFGETGRVDDRNLGLGKVGIHRTDDRKHVGIRDEASDVLRPLCGVVFSADGVVEVLERDPDATGEAAAVRGVDRQLHGITRRNRARAVDTRERQVEPESGDALRAAHGRNRHAERQRRSRRESYGSP